MIKFIKKFYVDSKFGFKQWLILTLMLLISLSIILILSSVYDIDINNISSL